MFTQTIKKGLVVTALLFNALALSMESEQTLWSSFKEWGVGKSQQVREYAKQGKEKFNNFLEGLNSQSSDSSDSESEVASEEVQSSSSDEEALSKEEVLVSALQSEDIDLSKDKVQVSWLRANAKALGFGALALVTVGATMYVLYKNGTLKKLVDVMKKHPYISAGVASAATIVTGYVAFKYYEPYMVQA